MSASARSRKTIEQFSSEIPTRLSREEFVLLSIVFLLLEDVKVAMHTPKSETDRKFGMLPPYTTLNRIPQSADDLLTVPSPGVMPRLLNVVSGVGRVRPIGLKESV